jgi:hypothetical protein
MTNQHRATPEQWERITDPGGAPSWACILELRARIEALEAAQQDKLDRLIALDREDPTPDAAMPKLRAWCPLNIETTYGSEAAADAAQILRAPMVVEGTFEHGGETYRFKTKPERESAMTEPRPASATHAMTDEQPKIARELTLANCNTLTTIPKITTNRETFVLLECYYDGDSNLVSDSFVACGDIENLKLLVPPEAELFMPWENVPDDGDYGDKRKRFRIALTPFLQEFNPPHALPIPASAEARPTVKKSLTDGGSLLEMVANAISEGDEPDKWHPEARDAIREVATWLDRFALHGSGEYAQAAKVLRQEVGR